MARHAESFDCKTCTHRHCDDSNPAGYPKWEIKGVLISRTCLLPMVTDYSRKLLSMHNHYDKGNLFTAGGIYDQPNSYLEAMAIITRVINS